MSTTLREAEGVAIELAPALREFPWFHGVAVEEDSFGFFVCVRVSPQISVDEARSKSLIPYEKHGVRVQFKQQQMARALPLGGLGASPRVRSGPTR